MPEQGFIGSPPPSGAAGSINSSVMVYYTFLKRTGQALSSRFSEGPHLQYAQNWKDYAARKEAPARAIDKGRDCPYTV